MQPYLSSPRQQPGWYLSQIPMAQTGGYLGGTLVPVAGYLGEDLDAAERRKTPFERSEERRETRRRLNNKYFQPPIMPPGRSDRESDLMDAWIRHLFDGGLSSDQVRDEIYREREPSLGR